MIPVLRLYKDILIGYLVSALGGGITITLVMLDCFSFGTAVSLALLWVLVCAVSCAVLVNKRLSALDRRRTEQCRPDEYITGYEALLAAHRSGKTRNFLLINLSAGYCDLGDPQRALWLLGQVVPHPLRNSRDWQRAIVHCNNIAAAYILLGQADDAEKALDDMNRLIKDGKMPAVANTIMYNHELRNRIEVAILRGQAAGMEKTLLLQLNQTTKLLEQVNLHYMIARIFLAGGEPEKAKEHLLFAAQHGGTTYHAREAAALLDTPDTSR